MLLLPIAVLCIFLYQKCDGYPPAHAGYMNERKQFHIEILSLFRSQHFFLYVGGIWFLFGWLFRLVCFIKYIFRQCLFEVAAQPIDFIETAFCILQGFLSGLFLQIVEFGQLVFFSSYSSLHRSYSISARFSSSAVLFPITYGIVSVVCFV